VEFTPDFVTIYDMHDNSKIVVGEVNHQSWLYTFSKFISKYDSSFLLTHSDDDSRFGHERFGNLNFRYMQQLNKQGNGQRILMEWSQEHIMHASSYTRHPR
jgi:hypothetical protein